MEKIILLFRVKQIIVFQIKKLNKKIPWSLMLSKVFFKFFLFLKALREGPEPAGLLRLRVSGLNPEFLYKV